MMQARTARLKRTDAVGGFLSFQEIDVTVEVDEEGDIGAGAGEKKRRGGKKTLKADALGLSLLTGRNREMSSVRGMRTEGPEGGRNGSKEKNTLKAEQRRFN